MLSVCLWGPSMEACDELRDTTALTNDWIWFLWQVRNTSSQTAHGVFVEAQGLLYPIGDLAPGQVIEDWILLQMPSCEGPVIVIALAWADNMGGSAATLQVFVSAGPTQLSVCLMGGAVDVCDGEARTGAEPGSTMRFWGSVTNVGESCAVRVQIWWQWPIVGGAEIIALQPGESSQLFEVDVEMPTPQGDQELLVGLSAFADNAPLTEARIIVAITATPYPELDVRMCFGTCPGTFLGIRKLCGDSGGEPGDMYTLRNSLCNVDVRVRNVGTGPAHGVEVWLEGQRLAGPMDIEPFDGGHTYTGEIITDVTRRLKGGATAQDAAAAWAYIDLEVMDQIPGPRLSLCLSAVGKVACDGFTMIGSVDEMGPVEFAAEVRNVGEWTATEVVISTNAGSTDLGSIEPGGSKTVRGTVDVQEQRTAIQAVVAGKDLFTIQATILVIVGRPGIVMNPMLIAGAVVVAGGLVVLGGLAGLKIVKKGVLL